MSTRLACLAALVLAWGCSGEKAANESAPTPAAEPPIVAEAFVTDLFADANLDSMAVWRQPTGSSELLVTSKTGDVLMVFDAVDGHLLRTIGASGNGPGQFRRPNGIAVIGNLALVVERDNARLQVIELPGDRPLGTFGGDVLRRPYGIAAFADATGRIDVFVTDNYETPDEQIPPDSELGRRVHHFRVRLAGGRLDVEHVRAFGETSGPGVLRKVETIAIDPVYDRVIVADEDEAIRALKIYTLDGRFTGQIINGNIFRTEPEGLALYVCGDDGYWISTDQHEEQERNVFHVLDRRTLELRSSFRGAVTRQTDGVALTQGGEGALGAGRFYAAHADAHVSAFDWETIAAAAGLPRTCGAS